MKKIDLQMHSIASDGTFSPKELVDLAIKKGMRAIAITDHDTISGLDEAIEHAKNKDIEIVPGVEISCSESEFKPTIDVLGLFIDHKDPDLNVFLDKYKEERVNEKKKIIEKLNSLGYEITFQELLEEGSDSLGRPSIARILIRKYPEKFQTIPQVFDKLIGKGKQAFVPRKKSTLKEAIEVIKKAGGISILAHPGRYLDESYKIIEHFIESGGKGIEIDYPYQKICGIDDKINQEFLEIARSRNLIVSGGSDFHDLKRGSEIGDAGLSEEDFEKMKSSLS